VARGRWLGHTFSERTLTVERRALTARTGLRLVSFMLAMRPLLLRLCIIAATFQS
jgi:hypothetical protein